MAVASTTGYNNVSELTTPAGEYLFERIAGILVDVDDKHGDG